MTDLAMHLACAHQTIQEVVQKMVHKGRLATRKSKRDGRCQIIKLTQKGRRALKSYNHSSRFIGKELLKGMNNQSQKLLLQLLTQSFNNLDE